MQYSKVIAISCLMLCCTFLLMLGSHVVPVTAQDAAPTVIAIINGQLIDGTGAPPLADGVVIIEGERIVAVGSTSEVAIPAGAQIIDAQDGTILPGIVDSHVHGVANPALRRDFLEDGVTSVCDLGSPIQYLPRFEERVTSLGYSAARGFPAGPIITTQAWANASTYWVATPEEVRAIVIELHELGVKMIKIYLDQGRDRDLLTLDQMQVNAIVEEAHARGMIVRAHISNPAMLEMALVGGVDVIEHIPLADVFFEDFPTATQADDPPMELLEPSLAVVDQLLTQAADQQVYMVPTFLVTQLSLDRTGFVSDDLIPFVIDLLVARVAHFRAAGGEIALGTDYVAGHRMPRGMPLSEFDYMLQAGMTPMEIITAGTQNAAVVCNQGDELGTLESSKLADIIIVPGDPSSDIHALADVTWVISGGEIAVQPE